MTSPAAAGPAEPQGAAHAEAPTAEPPRRRTRSRRAAPAVPETEAEAEPALVAPDPSPVAAEPAIDRPADAGPTLPSTSWRPRRPYVIDPNGKVRYLDVPSAVTTPAPPMSEGPAVETPAPEEAGEEVAAEEAEAAVVEAAGIGEAGIAPAEEAPSEAVAMDVPAGEETPPPPRRRRRSRRGGRGRHRNGSVPEVVEGEGPLEAEAAAEAIAEVPARAEVRPRPETPGPALSPLEALVARQNVILDQLIQRQTAMAKSLEQTLRAIERRLSGTDLSRVSAMPRLGVFVDVPNIMYAAERYNVQVDFGKLLEYVSRDRTLIRASAYAPISDDPTQRLELQRFVQPFVNHGYRIVTKPLKRFTDGSIKANFDVELAMDILTMSDRLDIVSLVSGDGDFRRLVEIVASKGVRVEVVAFAQSTAAELKAIADSYIDLTQHLRDLCVPAEGDGRPPRVRPPRIDVDL